PHFLLFLLLAPAVALGARAPVAPSTVCDPRDLGAVGDGQTNDQLAIQSAIDNCAAWGGGTVTLSAGAFLSAPVFLKTNVTLWLDSDATLLGTQDPNDYTWRPGWPNVGRSIVSLVNGGSGETDLGISGSGTIDGAGAWWWQYHLDNRPQQHQ